MKEIAMNPAVESFKFSRTDGDKVFNEAGHYKVALTRLPHGRIFAEVYRKSDDGFVNSGIIESPPKLNAFMADLSNRTEGKGIPLLVQPAER
jgi:hypothetical protein